MQAIYQEPSVPISERVADLLARLTPAEKIAQISGVWREGGRLFDGAGEFSPASAARVMPHGIGSVSRQREGLDPAATARFANALQEWLRDHTRLGIPALLHAEGLHGDMEKGGTHFPQPLALAASWDIELAHRIFTVVAREVRVRGGHQVLGPNLDLGRDPRWGRTDETFGEDPFLVSRFGVACVLALQGGDARSIGPDRVMATGKHFAAHGQPEGGTNGAPVVLPERLLRDLHFPPFAAAVREAGLASIMPAYHELDGVPCHANSWLLRNVLRGEWGFDGLVVSDYYAIEQLCERHGVVQNKLAAALVALRAGVEVELPETACFSELPALSNGEIPAEVSDAVDEAVARVLRFKFELGLFENPFVDIARAASAVNTPAHRALAREAAMRSCVLLKNEDDLLPICPETAGRIAVIGPNAERVHLGGYSDDPGCGVSVLDGIRERYGADRVDFAHGCKITEEGGDWWADASTLPDPAENQRLICDAAALAARADTVVLVIGGNEDTHKEAWHESHLGDRDTIELPAPQQELFDTVHAVNPRVVVVLIHGGPLAFPDLAERAPAILDAFYPGQEGGSAIAALLAGDVSPSGKLAITYPRSTGQIPAAYNHKPTARRGYLFTSKEPLYAFGHGLSYACFCYAELAVDRPAFHRGETVEVSVVVTNIGSCAGDEIVQLYVRDEVAGFTRPVRELKGFERVSLAAGERRVVVFKLGVAQLEFTGAEMRPVAEPGTFTIQVGPSSQVGATVRIELLD